MPPDGQMPDFDGTSMPEGMTPPDGEMPTFDGTSMPSGMTPPSGEMKFGGPEFEQEEAEEEEETVISTKKTLSEYDEKTRILLGASVLVLPAAILFALKFKRR